MNFLNKKKVILHSDPWLDGLDQDPYHQGLEAKQNFIEKGIKGGKIDVKETDFDKMSPNKLTELDKKKPEKISLKAMVELCESLIAKLEPGQNPNQLIKKLRPEPQKLKVFKKNIRKAQKDHTNKNSKIEEEEDKERRESFKEIVEMCDVLSSNGCLGDLSHKNQAKIFFRNIYTN